MERKSSTQAIHSDISMRPEKFHASILIISLLTTNQLLPLQMAICRIKRRNSDIDVRICRSVLVLIYLEGYSSSIRWLLNLGNNEYLLINRIVFNPNDFLIRCWKLPQISWSHSDKLSYVVVRVKLPDNERWVGVISIVICWGCIDLCKLNTRSRYLIVAWGSGWDIIFIAIS